MKQNNLPCDSYDFYRRIVSLYPDVLNLENDLNVIDEL
jgi:hypothetical protein